MRSSGGRELRQERGAVVQEWLGDRSGVGVHGAGVAQCLDAHRGNPRAPHVVALCAHGDAVVVADGANVRLERLRRHGGERGQEGFVSSYMSVSAVYLASCEACLGHVRAHVGREQFVGACFGAQVRQDARLMAADDDAVPGRL